MCDPRVRRATPQDVPLGVWHPSRHQAHRLLERLGSVDRRKFETRSLRGRSVDRLEHHGLGFLCLNIFSLEAGFAKWTDPVDLGRDIILSLTSLENLNLLLTLPPSNF